MAHPLESAITETIKNQRDLERKLSLLEQDLKAALERESILRGKIEALNDELADQKVRADHYLSWNVEITRQLQNIHMFVGDAMDKARVEVEKKGNSGMQDSIKAVEQALIGAADGKPSV